MKTHLGYRADVLQDLEGKTLWVIIVLLACTPCVLVLLDGLFRHLSGFGPICTHKA